MNPRFLTLMVVLVAALIYSGTAGAHFKPADQTLSGIATVYADHPVFVECNHTFRDWGADGVTWFDTFVDPDYDLIQLDHYYCKTLNKWIAGKNVDIETISVGVLLFAHETIHAKHHGWGECRTERLAIKQWKRFARWLGFSRQQVRDWRHFAVVNSREFQRTVC